MNRSIVFVAVFIFIICHVDDAKSQGVSNRQFAKQSENPWNVQVVYNFSASQKLGYILSDKWVLTTAHGIDRGVVIVQYGMRFDDSYRGRCVKSKHIHNEYNAATGHNDIALLGLYHSIGLGQPFTNKIYLPAGRHIDRDRGLQFRSTFISYYHNELDYPHRVFWRPTTVLSHEACMQRRHHVYSAADKDMHREHHICDNNNKTFFDRWHPTQNLIAFDASNRRFTLVGLSSHFENNCRDDCDGNHPRKFIRIDAHLRWIANHTNIDIHRQQ